MSDEIVNENTPENPAAEEAVVPTEAGTEVAAAAESVDSSPSEDASPVAEGGKFDKLKKAEDIPPMRHHPIGKSLKIPSRKSSISTAVRRW